MSPLPSHIDEPLLIVRLEAGDPVARQFLYDKYGGAIYGIILQLVPERTKADEILVKVFTYAMQHIRAFKDAGHFSLFAWLMKLAREISLRETSPASGALEALPADRQLTIRNDHYMQRFTASLPEQCSQVFLLCYFKGLSTQAVARLLDLQETAVKQSLLVAMVEFRKYLQSNWS
ncbi:MAG TPA: sigma-70 family RNA polymerase sigma factor [Chitinophaga sp.]